MAASVEMLYGVAGSLPPQVTQDPRGFALSCIVPDSLVGGLVGPAGSGILEVQMITSAQVEIKAEASHGPEHKTLKITGGLINICAAYILMMKRYLDAERTASLAVQSSQNLAPAQSPQNLGETDALSKALNWMTELRSSSTGPDQAATPAYGTTPSMGTFGTFGTMPGQAVPGAARLPALHNPGGPNLGDLPPLQNPASAGLSLQPGTLNQLQYGGQMPGLQGLQQQLQQQPLAPQSQHLQQLQQQLPQGAQGTAQAVALSNTLLQQAQQGLASNDPKVKEMTQLQEHLNALQAQVAAQNLRQ